MKELSLGPLRAQICGGTDREGGGTGPVVVLMHGYGAPGSDLVPLWRELMVPHDVRFVFPEAPLELDFGGRAWWTIDMQRLQDRSQLETLISEEPEGLSEARAQLLTLLDELELQIGSKPETTVLGGFSQGAMLATDTVLRSDRKFAALAVMSGTLICQQEWRTRMPTRRGLPVLLSHGRTDNVLPFSLAERLRDEFTTAGLNVDFVPFNGGHGLGGSVVEHLGALVSRVTASATP